MVIRNLTVVIKLAVTVVVYITRHHLACPNSHDYPLKSALCSGDHPVIYHDQSPEISNIEKVKPKYFLFDNIITKNKNIQDIHPVEVFLTHP